MGADSDLGMSQRLPRRVGPSKAREMMLTCRNLQRRRGPRWASRNLRADDAFDKDLRRWLTRSSRIVVQSSREQAAFDRDRWLAARPGLRMKLPNPGRPICASGSRRFTSKSARRAEIDPAPRWNRPARPAPTAVEPPSERRGAFRALRIELSLYFFGQLISLPAPGSQAPRSWWC